MFRRPEVLRRVVVEFGTLPELRGVNVHFDGRSVRFREQGGLSYIGSRGRTSVRALLRHVSRLF